MFQKYLGLASQDALLTHTPSVEMIQLVEHLQKQKFVHQIEYLKTWAKYQLDRLIHMKNLTITMLQPEEQD